MTVTVTIKTDNAAFEDGGGTETARILRKLADRIDGSELEAGERVGLLDVNGNHVGFYKTR